MHLMSMLARPDSLAILVVRFSQPCFGTPQSTKMARQCLNVEMVERLGSQWKEDSENERPKESEG